MAFATSLVLGPEAEHFYGSSGSGYRSQAATATNYHPEKFLTYLEESHARYGRSGGPTRLEDDLYRDVHAAAVALALNKSKTLPGEVDEALSTLRKIAGQLSAADIISYVASVSRRPESFEDFRQLMADREVAGEDLMDLLSPIVRGGLSKHFYGIADKGEQKELLNQLSLFSKKYDIPHRELIRVARTAGKGFR